MQRVSVTCRTVGALCDHFMFGHEVQQKAFVSLSKRNKNLRQETVYRTIKQSA